MIRTGLAVHFSNISYFMHRLNKNLLDFRVAHLYVLYRLSPHLRLPPFTDGGKSVVLRGVHVSLVAHTHFPLVEVTVPGGRRRGGKRRVIPLLRRISMWHVAHRAQHNIHINQHAYATRIHNTHTQSRSPHMFLSPLLYSSSLQRTRLRR